MIEKTVCKLPSPIMKLRKLRGDDQTAKKKVKRKAWPNKLFGKVPETEKDWQAVWH